MDPRLQLRIQRHGWDAAAAYYDAGWQAQLCPAHDRLLHMAGLTAGQRVIETACGTGLVTLRAAEQVGSNGKILATDLSEAMWTSCIPG
jgi:cyclopropane fatty-acyl-phospholipid synthase-like methyltransferase